MFRYCSISRSSIVYCNDYFLQRQKVILAVPLWAISLAIEYAVVFGIHDDLVKSINSKFWFVFYIMEIVYSS